MISWIALPPTWLFRLLPFHFPGSQDRTRSLLSPFRDIYAHQEEDDNVSNGSALKCAELLELLLLLLLFFILRFKRMNNSNNSKEEREKKNHSWL